MPSRAVTPLPPLAEIDMPWDVAVLDPVAEVARARNRLGDTFVVDSVDDRFLFLFSPEGVRSFYELDEAEASKGVADWRMLRRKVPPELFDGRRTLPHELFGRSEVDVQVRSLDLALDRMTAALATGDVFDVFDWSRRLGHLIGLTSWGGVELLDVADLDLLVGALDGLDAAEAFVHPERMAAIAASGYSAERAALSTAARIIGDVIARRISDPGPRGDLLDVVIANWDGGGETSVEGAALDVVLVHLASMSNLFAAIGWAIVDVASRPAVAAGIRSGDRDLTVRCALESIRLAQRSIMLRHTLVPVTVTTEEGPIAVAAGVTIATLVPLTNSPLGLHDYDPDHWDGRRLAPHVGLTTKELVTTFGHGRHTCPARSFSLRAIASTVEALLDDHDLELLDADPRPVPSQIGGVARAAGPCRIRLVHQRRG